MRHLVAICALIGLAAGAVFQSTIWRKETLKGKLKRLGKWNQYRDFLESRGLRRPVKNGTFTHHVNDFGDFMYAANVSIGNPPQQFSVDLDTGSGDSWVPDTKCGPSARQANAQCKDLPKDMCEIVCPPASCEESSLVQAPNPCVGKRHFNSSASSSYSTSGGNWSIEYGTGTASGIDGTDDIRLGDSQSLVVKSYDFGQAQRLTDDFGQDFHADGLFGLSPDVPDTGANKTIIEAAAEQGVLDAPVFTVWLEEKGQSEDVRAGVFTYGGIDSVNCGPVIGYVPITPFADDGAYHWWKFGLQGFSIGNYSQKGKFEAISDTGTSFLIASPDYADAVAKTVGAGEYTDGFYPIDCSATFEPIVFTIGGKQYPVDHEQLIVHLNTTQCALALDQGGIFDPFDWLLGDPWVRQYCQVHDFGKKRIGFAKANP